MTGLEALPISEIEKLNIDEQYREDTIFTMPVVMQIEKKQHAIEDETLKMAKENIKKAELAVGDLEVYEETIHPNFVELQEKAQTHLGKIEEKLDNFSRKGHIKVLNDAANVKYKESDKMKKNYLKSCDSPNLNEFIKTYIKERQSYHMLIMYKDIISQAPEV